jgi:glycine dehydrogenase subunit 2
VRAVAPFAPLPLIVANMTSKSGASVYDLAEHADDVEGDGRIPFGRMCAFHGQMGMFVRALTYMFSHGSDGLRQVAEDAVLNANYLLARLRSHYNAPFGDGPCMHEALFDDTNFKGEGIETIDFAKALLDEGYHPFTTYFPLVVHGAMLVEPTETESKAGIDQFITALRSVAERAKAGDVSLKSAPHFAPRRRLDETLAARKPVLVWKEPELAVAAE